MSKYITVEADIEWMFRGRTIGEVIGLLQECRDFCGKDATLDTTTTLDEEAQVLVTWHREATQEDHDAADAEWRRQRAIDERAQAAREEHARKIAAGWVNPDRFVEASRRA